MKETPIALGVDETKYCKVPTTTVKAKRQRRVLVPARYIVSILRSHSTRDLFTRKYAYIFESVKMPYLEQINSNSRFFLAIDASRRYLESTFEADKHLSTL
jgi:hypothetical protein